MIDLRSDACTEPTEPMWAAMRAARLGWATFGEDESVVALERAAAALLGKEAAVLAPTCTAANLAAMLVLARPGDLAVAEASAHVLTSEELGIVHLARLKPRPVEGVDGRLDPDAVAATRPVLLLLENTHTRAGGTVLTPELTAALAAAAPRTHLDGARLPNAAVALGASLAELAAPVDTVALSLNKALSAPYGAVLAGEAAVVAEARVHLKRLGGGSVHRAGLLAAAGLVALETMLDRIADDHRRARDLAEHLARIPGAEVGPVETNIVLFELAGVPAAELSAALETRGVRAFVRDERRLRFVTYRLIDDAAVEGAVAAVAAVARSRHASPDRA